MAAYNDTLYIVSTDKILASIDNGKTWYVLCSRPKGHPIGLIVMDEIQGGNSALRPVMYLALQDEGVFRSTDAGTQWALLKDGLADESITAVAAIRNIVFAGTSSGIYRLDSDIWQQLSASPSDPVYWMTGFENSLYVGTGSDLSHCKWIEPGRKFTGNIIADSTRINLDRINLGGIFHSTDFGASWTEITHGNDSDLMKPELGVHVLANTGKVLLSQGIVAVDKNTFYRASSSGIHRTTDGGKSWHSFTSGIMETTIQNLVAINNRLYGYTRGVLVQSVDGGETWETVQIDCNSQIRETIEQKFGYLNLASQLAVANDVLYGIAPEKDSMIDLKLSEITSIKDYLGIFQLSAGSSIFVPVQGAPAFERESGFVELWTEDSLPNKPEKNDNASGTTYLIDKFEGIGGFAVTGQTFYAEWKQRLFKWKHGDPEWTDTGLIDTTEPLHKILDRGFKLAVSGDTVYVGKRDGKLFQSLDGGKSWKNITPTLPLHFTGFKQIVFAGTTVYVATDEGVLSSETGAHWQVLTDGMGAHTVINKFAVHHTSVYGADAAGIYRLDPRGKWEQISASVPDKIVSLAVSHDRLYIATQQRGIFHIPLEAQL